MERFGLHGKLVAQPGKRDALAAHLLEAAELMRTAPGCDIYVVSTSPSDVEAVWVTEVWRSEADHDDSLSIPGVRELIRRARPLIADTTGSTRLVVLGGKGL